MTDIALMKRQIEAQMAAYEQEVADAAAFLQDWRNRTDPATKRVQRFRQAARTEAAE